MVELQEIRIMNNIPVPSYYTPRFPHLINNHVYNYNQRYSPNVTKPTCPIFIHLVNIDNNLCVEYSTITLSISIISWQTHEQLNMVQPLVFIFYSFPTILTARTQHSPAAGTVGGAVVGDSFPDRLTVSIPGTDCIFTF